ncbi:MAG: hypothetical protein LBF67_06685 [Prevotellaceae bacterium]|nr:hypothetical protein [Prevotellaceae bacterium]
MMVAIGIGGGALCYDLSIKIYRSEAIIRSNSLASNIIVGNIESLNNLFRSGNYAELSSLLRISKSGATKISRLSVYYGLLPVESNSNTLNQPVYYVSEDWHDTAAGLIPSRYIKIVAEVFDENVYPQLTSGLLTFISRNSFNSELNTLRVEQLRSQITYIEQGISTLRRLQATPTPYNTTFPPVLELNSSPKKGELVQLQDAITSLQDKKIEIERELALFAQPVTVIADFSKVYRPVNNRLTYMLLGAIIAFALGLTALLLRDNRKKITNALREKM